MLDALGESCMAMLRTGVRLPHLHQLENKPCFGLRRHRMDESIHAVFLCARHRGTLKDGSP